MEGGRGEPKLTHIIIHPCRTQAGFTAPPRYRCDDRGRGGLGECQVGRGREGVVVGRGGEEQMKALRSQIRGSGGADNPSLRSTHLFLIPAGNLSRRHQPLS